MRPIVGSTRPSVVAAAESATCKCVPEDLADRNRPTRRAVEEAQLRVVPEAAAGQVEGTQTTDELRAGGGHRRRIGSQEHGGRAEGVKRGACRRGHEPPETTTGAADEDDTEEDS